MFWWHWKHLGSMWHPAFTPPVDFLESQELGDMPCMRFHHAARPKQETWEIIRFQHQPLSKRVEFSFHPQEEKLCWKKKTLKLKEQIQSPQKKNGIPFWKMPKDFPTFPTESAAAQHTQSTRTYRWHGAGCPWEPSRQLHPNPSTTSHESNLLWPQKIHRCLSKEKLSMLAPDSFQLHTYFKI